MLYQLSYASRRKQLIISLRKDNCKGPKGKKIFLFTTFMLRAGGRQPREHTKESKEWQFPRVASFQLDDQEILI